MAPAYRCIVREMKAPGPAGGSKYCEQVTSLFHHRVRAAGTAGLYDQ